MNLLIFKKHLKLTFKEFVTIKKYYVQYENVCLKLHKKNYTLIINTYFKTIFEISTLAVQIEKCFH